MRRYLQTDIAWWASMMPAFFIAIYFVNGWFSHRDQPSMLLSAIGAIAMGVLMTCWAFARYESNLYAETTSEQPEPATVQPPQQPQQSAIELPPPAAEPTVPPDPWMTKGLNLARAKQYRDALYCFSYVLQSDPTNQAALTAKGKCLMEMNRPEEALKAFMQAAGIDQNDPGVKEAKAALLRRVRAATWM